MSRLDDLIADLTSSRISRRQFMQRAAALGLSVPALGLIGTSNALALEGNKVRWVSPRGRLEVLDDYAYWVAKKFGYFGDIETVIEGGPGAASAGVALVDANQSDMAFPSPGVFSGSLEQGVPVVSVFHEVAQDTFDFAFRKGQMVSDLKELEGKTIVLGDAGWSLITNPLLAQFGVDFSKINYVAAGVTAWGQVFAQGQGDAVLAWESLRAQWQGEGLDFDYWLGKEHSKFPANSFVIRKSDFDDAATHDIYTRYLRGWAMGLEFGFHNPRAATQITMEVPEIKDALNQSFPDKSIAVESLWQGAQIYRGDWANRQGWGWHDLDSWNLYFQTVKQIGQMTKEVNAADVVKNDFIAGANEFDHDTVKQDALSFQLSAEFAAVPEPAGAGVDAGTATPSA
ncbi:MAG TPA: ABC transporter substrate-binding protein [Thermomicrobiales bacterium]|jgi:NitT/TauT family transport system substrate-binding protein